MFHPPFDTVGLTSWGGWMTLSQEQRCLHHPRMSHRTNVPRMFTVGLVMVTLVSGGVGLGASLLAFSPPVTEHLSPGSGSSAVSKITSSSVLGLSTRDCVVMNISTRVATSDLYSDPVTGNLYAYNGADAIYEIDASSGSLMSPPIFVKGGGSQSPDTMAFDQFNGLLYVADGAQPYVSVIDIASDQVIANISLSSHAVGVAFDEANQQIYVAGYGGLVDELVSVINTTTNTVIRTMSVGALPGSIAFDNSNDEVYVANQGSNNISVINGSSNRVVGSIAVGSVPASVVTSPTSGLIYVANPSSYNVTVISATTDRTIASIRVPELSDSGAMALDNRDGRLYVEGNYSLYAVNLTTSQVVSEDNLSSYSQGGLLSYVTYDRVNSHVFADSMQGYLYSVSPQGNCNSTPPPPTSLWSEPELWVVASLGILTIALLVYWGRKVKGKASTGKIEPHAGAPPPP